MSSPTIPVARYVGCRPRSQRSAVAPSDGLSRETLRIAARFVRPSPTAAEAKLRHASRLATVTAGGNMLQWVRSAARTTCS